MLNRIIASIMIFLLSVFPNSPFLIRYNQNRMYPGEQKIADMIVEMIKTDNVDEIYKLTSGELKEKNPNLKQELHEMIALVEEDILSYKPDRSGFTDTPTQSSVALNVDIKTSTKWYNINMRYIKSNPYNPELVGIQKFVFHEFWFDSNHNRVIKTSYQIYPEYTTPESVLIVEDAIKENNPEALFNISTGKLTEKYPDLKDLYRKMLDMIDGNFIENNFEINNYISEHWNLRDYTTFPIRCKTDKGTYLVTVNVIEYAYKLPANNPNYGIAGFTLQKINDDGTCKELFSVMDEESWMPFSPHYGIS